VQGKAQHLCRWVFPEFVVPMLTEVIDWLERNFFEVGIHAFIRAAALTLVGFGDAITVVFRIFCTGPEEAPAGHTAFAVI